MSILTRPITVDPQGLHLCSGCYHDNVKNIIHNNLRDCIISTFNHLGLQTIREPTNQFRAVNPEDSCRPDIKVLGLSDRPLLLDVTVTSPVPANNPHSLSFSDAKIPLRQSKRRHQTKVKAMNANQSRTTWTFYQLFSNLQAICTPMQSTYSKKLSTDIVEIKTHLSSQYGDSGYL